MNKLFFPARGNHCLLLFYFFVIFLFFVLSYNKTCRAGTAYGFSLMRETQMISDTSEVWTGDISQIYLRYGDISEICLKGRNYNNTRYLHCLYLQNISSLSPVVLCVIMIVFLQENEQESEHILCDINPRRRTRTRQDT